MEVFAVWSVTLFGVIQHTQKCFSSVGRQVFPRSCLVRYFDPVFTNFFVAVKIMYPYTPLFVLPRKKNLRRKFIWRYIHGARYQRKSGSFSPWPELGVIFADVDGVPRWVRARRSGLLTPLKVAKFWDGGQKDFHSFLSWSLRVNESRGGCGWDLFCDYQ